MKFFLLLCTAITAMHTHPMHENQHAATTPPPPVTLIKKIRRRRSEPTNTICLQSMTLEGTYEQRIEAVRVKLLWLACCSMRHKKRKSI